MSKESEIIKDLMLTRCASWQEVAEFLYFDMGYTAKEVQEIKEKERPTWEYYENFSWNERINIIYKEQQENFKFEKLLKEEEREQAMQEQLQKQLRRPPPEQAKRPLDDILKEAEREVEQERQHQQQKTLNRDLDRDL